MTEPTPAATAQPATGCCCAKSDAPTPAVEVKTASAPCCGTATDAAKAGACCAPAAKSEAVAAGAGCC
ncbi:hypothetical protein [Streptomyces sp. NRRL B-24484]|uniref:hypothetical protein n=1 Tax=Streptomyces sp. NRRL B-24484 TaxID=1463833 RepID=UPI0004C23138|nr:hypothetical protein [Streptomyces sp. NRRL B-24484]